VLIEMYFRIQCLSSRQCVGAKAGFGSRGGAPPPGGGRRQRRGQREMFCGTSPLAGVFGFPSCTACKMCTVRKQELDGCNGSNCRGDPSASLASRRARDGAPLGRVGAKHVVGPTLRNVHAYFPCAAWPLGMRGARGASYERAAV